MFSDICFNGIMPHPIGLLGGTFDPIHVGHLSMAQWAVDALGLKEVWLIPAGQPPHKTDRQVTPAQHRLRMCELAVAHNPQLKICNHEIVKTTPSFTIETLTALRPQFENDPWLIIGLDSLLNLKHWYRWQEFPMYCRLAVLPRQDQQIKDAQSLAEYVKEHLPMFENQVQWLDLPQVDISSTLLRKVLRAGYDTRYALTTPVWSYIQENALYRSSL
jgi:nicotinate-nucleotide adenylyltransferase